MANWRVTETAAITFHGEFGYGFNVVNEHGRPAVTYESDDAKEAAAQIRAALGKARIVQPHSLT